MLTQTVARSLVALPLVLGLAACGGQAADVASSASTTDPTTPAPSPSLTESSTPAPTETSVAPSPDPSGASFTDVAEVELAQYSTLLGQPTTVDLAAVLPRFTADVPLPAGTVTGAGWSMEQWQGRITGEQMIGLDAVLKKSELEKFGASVPGDWKFNSISTTDSAATLVATRTADGLRLVVASYSKPDAGKPTTEVKLEDTADAMLEPAWLATLPTLEGGELAAVGEGVGEVLIDYVPAGNGLVTVRWRYEGDRLQEIQDYLMSGSLEVAGFTLVDPESIRIGASAFDVTAGDWSGQVVVGTTSFEGKTLTDLVWLLQKG